MKILKSHDLVDKYVDNLLKVNKNETFKYVYAVNQLKQLLAYVLSEVEKNNNPLFEKFVYFSRINEEETL